MRDTWYVPGYVTCYCGYHLTLDKRFVGLRLRWHALLHHRSDKIIP